MEPGETVGGGVVGGFRFAFGGAGAGGILGVAAIGFDAFLGCLARHGLLLVGEAREQRPAAVRVLWPGPDRSIQTGHLIPGAAIPCK